MSTFSQQNYRHGNARLNANDSSNLALVSNDGGEILVQNSSTGDYFPVALYPSGIVQNLFNNTAYVMGTANQSLSSNTLYSVYLMNLDGTESGCVMDFWPTFSGYNPIIESNGMFVANTGGVDIGKMYLGQIWTGSSNIQTVMTGDNLQQCAFSHFNPWCFGFQTNQNNVNFSPSMNGAQSSPSILFASEGIVGCSVIHGQLIIVGNNVGSTINFSIQVSGTAIDGSGGSQSWTVSSPMVNKTITTTNCCETLSAVWMSAPPIGIYTAKPVINLNSGSATIACSLLGEIIY
jgi:hypothetical protein